MENAEAKSITRVSNGIILISLFALCACATAVDAGRAEVSTERIVRLPPFLVQADQVMRLYHGEFSGLQVLSSCDRSGGER